MRKFFCLLLILLMFINLQSCVPVYAEDYESYTLEPGKIYRFKKVKGQTLTAEFSDYVLISSWNQAGGYTDKSFYRYKNNVTNSGDVYVNVYNTSNKSVVMTMTEGTTTEVAVFNSPFSLVMYDGTETSLQIINNGDNSVTFKRYTYNESDYSFDYLGNYLGIGVGKSRTLSGKGFIVFTSSSLQDVTFEGVYGFVDYISEYFFHTPPWILRMDLAGMIRVLLDQLSMLLPVGLVILSVFLLISLLLYTIHLLL